MLKNFCKKKNWICASRRPTAGAGGERRPCRASGRRTRRASRFWPRLPPPAAGPASPPAAGPAAPPASRRPARGRRSAADPAPPHRLPTGLRSRRTTPPPQPRPGAPHRRGSSADLPAVGRRREAGGAARERRREAAHGGARKGREPAAGS